jgi:hypothetical protein
MRPVPQQQSMYGHYICTASFIICIGQVFLLRLLLIRMLVEILARLLVSLIVGLAECRVSRRGSYIPSHLSVSWALA